MHANRGYSSAAARTLFALAVAVAGMTPSRTRAGDEPLLLAVEVNGFSTGQIGEFVARDGLVLAKRTELVDLGFRLPPGLPGDALTDLATLPGLKWRLDMKTQTIFITAPDADLTPALLAPDAAPVGSRAVESGTGASLNYDVTDAFAAGHNAASGLLDLRLFSPRGVVSSGALVHAGAGPTGRGLTLIRLDTTYTFSDPQKLRRYRAGDFISGSLSWTRALHLGGVQITSDFTLRPDLVTFPLPTVSGSAAVPSTVDVLVNGNRLLSRDVGAGPFQIPSLPVVSGAGTVSIAVTNPLGQRTIVTLPFYANAALLAPGLQTFSAQAGAQRRNVGILNNDYRAIAVTGTYRRGLTDRLTVETIGEATAGTAMAGAGIVLNVANLALLNAAFAASGGGGKHGTQLAVGLQRVDRRFSLGFAETLASRDYRDVAATGGDAIPRLQLTANVGFTFGRLGSLGVSYSQVDRDGPAAALPVVIGPAADLAPLDPVYLAAAEHAKIVSASYSATWRGISLTLTGFKNFVGSGGTGVAAALSMPFGRRGSVGAGAGVTGDGAFGNIQATRSAVSIGDFGYQANVATGAATSGFVEGQYKARWGLLAGGADVSGGQVTLRASARGSLAFLGGNFYAANTIDDSFAVVDTNGLAGVQVLSENRDMGRTDRHGHLLVPELRSFDVNHLSILPTDIPQDTTIVTTTRDVRPQDRSGLVIGFAVKVSHGALLHIVDAGGDLVIGSTATLRATHAMVPVGYDGSAYLEDLAAHDTLAIERPDGSRCVATFDYIPVAGEIPTIGPVQCR